MPDATGNRFCDPDVSWDEHGRRKMEIDPATGELRPTKPRVVNENNIVEDTPFLGKREGGARKYGKQFYEEPVAQPAPSAADATSAETMAGDEAFLPFTFDDPKALLVEINSYGGAARQGDKDAQDTLIEIARREYGRAGEPRPSIRGALSRNGIRKPKE